MSQQRAWPPKTPESEIEVRVLKGERPIIKDRHLMPKEITDLIVKGWSHRPEDRYSFDIAKIQLNDLLNRTNKE